MIGIYYLEECETERNAGCCRGIVERGGAGGPGALEPVGMLGQNVFDCRVQRFAGLINWLCIFHTGLQRTLHLAEILNQTVHGFEPTQCWQISRGEVEHEGTYTYS